MIHTMMKLFGPAMMAVLLTVSCADGSKKNDWSENRQRMEAQAQKLLGEARQALARRDFDTATQKIETMRHTCNLALEARQEGILFMDSLYIQETVAEMLRIDSLLKANAEDSLILAPHLEECGDKLKFYRRKLEHDRAPRR